MDRRLLSVLLATSVGITGPALVGSAAANAAAAGPALTVDVSAGRHTIDPDIYGMNYADPTLARELHLTADRWGGNSTNRYNFRNNTTNTGSDYYFENVRPNLSLDQFVRRDLRRHTQPVVTVPMTGWVARKSPSSHPFFCSFKVSKFGSQQDTDPYDPDCGNGVAQGGNKLTANPQDTSVKADPAFVTAMAHHLVALFGHANKGGVKTYELDNEPSLWNSTHRDVHPHPVTYSELWTRSKATATAVKKADPSAAVAGPGDWGWCAYFFSAADPDGCSDGSDRRSHGDQPMAAWYLKQFATAQKSTGERLLDYFDEHYYPQESGVSLSSAGNASVQALRLRSTRSSGARPAVRIPTRVLMTAQSSTVRLPPSARMPAPLLSGTRMRVKVRPRTTTSRPPITNDALPAQARSDSTTPGPVAAMVSRLACQIAQS